MTDILSVLQIKICSHYYKFKCRKMQLLFRKFKKNLPPIWLNKFGLTLLILLNIHGTIVAELTCHQCYGINCLRTSYNATQKCVNSLDICATVFEGQTVLAQGCLEQLSHDLRGKCYPNRETNNQDSINLNECFKCNKNLCNNLASQSFECIQCDSKSDDNCRSNPESIKPTRCLVTRTPNEYCFVRREGEAIVRGCSYTLKEQIECLSSEDCTICQPNEIRGCNAVALPVNGSESGGNNNGSGGSTEGGSNNGSNGSDGTDGGSNNNTGGDGSGGSGGGSAGNEGSGSGNESNGNDNNGSQGGGSNGNSVARTKPYIYISILSICNLYMFARE